MDDEPIKFPQLTGRPKTGDTKEAFIGDPGHTRQKAEFIAALFDENTKTFDEICRLDEKLNTADRQLEQKVKEYIGDGFLEINKVYLTSLGALAIFCQGDAGGRVRVSLLPIADKCDHARPGEIPF